jgi:DNA-binding transcriptional LysR family regulator
MSLTQSAVSVLVRGFEQSCGVRLFDRTARTLRPTPLAREMLVGAERILHDIETFGRLLKERADRERGTVDIAVTPSIGTTVIPGILEAFSLQYPHVKVLVHDVWPSDILVLVASGSAAFGMGTFEPRIDMDRVPVMSYGLVLVCRRSMAPTRARRISWDAVSALPVISVKGSNSIRSWIDESVERTGRRFEPAWEVSQFASAIAMVQQNLGCAILPSYLRYDYAALDMIAIEIVKPRTTRDLVIVTRRNAAPAPTTEALIAMIRANLAPVSRPRSR